MHFRKVIKNKNFSEMWMMIKRETYLTQLRELKDVQIIKVIAGVRRCGKSTLLEQVKNELLSGGVPAFV